MNFYNEEINSLYSIFKSNSLGINQNSVLFRQEKYGKNELDKQKKDSFIKKLLYQFKNIMIIILIISAVISISNAIICKNQESLIEGILIFVIVFLNSFVGVIQEQKAENALLALQKSIEPTAKVIRNGKLSKIKVSNIVVGDIIELKAGDYIPADIRIIDSTNFKCDESSLTGESHSVDKNNKTIKKKNVPLAEIENMCFSGTTATSGKAKGIVVSVGKSTEIGKIAKILSKEIKEKTPLEKNIDKIGKVLTIAVLVIVFIMFFVQLFLNKSATIIDSLLTAVALAVAAIPESLPAVITIIMALGVQKLARKNAIVKKLSAVETLGCCNVICSDKTGTLTQNKMKIKKIFTNNSFVDLKNKEKFSNLTIPACLCNSIQFDKNNKISADATETAIAEFLIDNNIQINEIKKQYKKIYEKEFDSTKKTMSTVFEFNKSKTLYKKGAIDYLLKDCSFCLINNEIIPLSEQMKNKILAENEKVCENGCRVIAFAKKENIKDFNDEKDMIFIGFLGLIDPPKNEAIKSIKTCKKAGLNVIMITGDHPSTAFAIAKNLGISNSKNQVLTGDKIDKLSEKELSKIIQNYRVFARVTPEHKLKIVKALKQNKNIVSMTGDGINDAPSIKCANIGVCMGKTGTDVTKEVSDIIISDDNFNSIVVAIKEGRTIYKNIEKTILFLISTNVVEVLSIFIISLLLPNVIFLTPAQILFINLVTDALPAFALGLEPPDKNIMNTPPRNPKQSILSGKMTSSIIYQGFIQSLAILIMFVCSVHYFNEEVARTMAFLTICLIQIIHAINCKTELSLFKHNIYNNKFFNFSFIFLFCLILFVYFCSPLATLFGLAQLTLCQWLIIFGISFSIIPFVEIGKLFIK